MDKDPLLSDDELMENGIEALNQVLGATNALRFLSLISHDKTDYVELSRSLYMNQSAEDIFARVKSSWRGNPSQD
ncbi:MAG: hypothetical protein CVV27_01970 [Candidatus Melainabacteria bacterium HGW-Melainabacteria-1]|nr:MAG: hypothetical protein CVV27_01970 [Candidatus Melainabacteria bacterium HGW-Melainabacteria-1]